MPIIEYDTYKQKLGAMEPELEKLAAALDLENAKKEIAKLEQEQADENFWSDLENSQKVLQRTKQLQHKVDKHAHLVSQWEDLTTLVEMAIEEDDDSLLEEITQGYTALEAAVEEANLDTLLSGEYDNNNAILNFHAGAGGTEAQDWAQMLYRMYMRWAERHDFKFETIDYLDGDEAGIKSASVIISGENAYGYLKSESGVHRLVRISPFDASGRRQTSFAALEVMPDIADDNEVDIRPEDLKVDTYRSSGAGGQHVNKTESAIRITHLPTGVVVECQDERSQYKNKDRAMKILRTKLYEAELEKQNAAIAAQRRSQVGSGDRSERIRTYNFPQGRVTDHRLTGDNKNFNIDAVMNGGLDPIIDALTTADQAAKLAAAGEGNA